MLERYRQCNPGRSIAGIAFFGVCAFASEIVCTLLWRYRSFGRRRVPQSGPLLVVANHQSHLDPVAVGLIVRPRQMNFLARSTLFFPGFGWLIRALNSVPLKQGATDTAAIRSALEQLGMGRVVLLFPEGSRTPDGAMHPFKRGVWLLLSRANCPVLPVGIEGAYDALPRGTTLPRIGVPVYVNIGERIACETLKAMGPDAALAHLARRVEALRLELHASMTSTGARLTTRPMSDTVVD